MHAQSGSLSPIANTSIRRVAAAPAILVSNGVAPPPRHVERSRDISRRSDKGRNRPTWDRAFSAALVAAIVLALTTGLWRASDGTPFGSGDGPPDSPGIPFGGQVAQDDSGDINPADLTTAEDCTVEPLTVADVIAILQERYPSTGWYPAEFEEHATPVGERLAQGIYPSEQTVEAAASVQHMWMACNLAGLPFQRWALETPANIQEEVIAALPPLTGVDEAQAILEDLEQNGTRDDFQPIPTRQGPMDIVLVDPNPRNSWELPDGYLVAGILIYNTNGQLLTSRSAQSSKEFAAMTGGSAAISCSVLQVGLATDQVSWLVNSTDVGCG